MKFCAANLLFLTNYILILLYMSRLLSLDRPAEIEYLLPLSLASLILMDITYLGSCNLRGNKIIHMFLGLLALDCWYMLLAVDGGNTGNFLFYLLSPVIWYVSLLFVLMFLFQGSLKRTHPEIKIVLLTGYDLPVYRHEAKKAGVSGFLNKSISPEELVASLQNIYHGNACFPPESQDFFIEDLTDAEKKVLQLLCAGKKRKEAAKELYISERTLSNHLQHIFEKLSVTSTVEAVTKAIRLGYLLPEREKSSRGDFFP